MHLLKYRFSVFVMNAATRAFIIRQYTSAYASIRQHTSAYFSIRQHTSACVSMRQHTSASVSIRQHPSASVSIRQHTSAYVSIFTSTRAHFESTNRRVHVHLLSACLTGLSSGASSSLIGKLPNNTKSTLHNDICRDIMSTHALQF